MSSIYAGGEPIVDQRCGTYYDQVAMILVDKSTSEVIRVSAPVGASFEIGGPTASIEVCYYICSQQYRGYGAVLNIFHLAKGGVFSNWIFEKYPGIRIPSEIKYDIDLLKCE